MLADMLSALLLAGALAAPAAAEPPGPDIFGAVALRLRTTRFDARWRRVSDAPLPAGFAPAAGILAELRGLGPRPAVERVNAWVNARVEYREDRALFGEEDRWVTAQQALSRGRGDCEDYVIAKLQLLRAAGFDPADLYMAVVKDLIAHRDHALLLVRVEGRLLVLDNRTDVIQQDPRGADYRPILTLSHRAAWTYGYRPEPDPVRLAGR